MSINGFAAPRECREMIDEICDEDHSRETETVTAAVKKLHPQDHVRLSDAYVPAIGASVEWPLDLFEHLPGVDVGDPIDLTGQQKTLLFGPYIRLPAGLWQATMRFSVDPQGGEVQARFDWGSLERFSTDTYLIQKAGEYEVRMTQAWNSPQAAEFRAFTCRPSFQGFIRFQRLVVERLVEKDAPTS